MNRFGRRIVQMAAASPTANWLQDPSNVLGIHADLDTLRARLHSMSDAESTAFGKQMHELVYPLTYGSNGKPSVSAFSIQLEEATWSGDAELHVVVEWRAVKR